MPVNRFGGNKAKKAASKRSGDTSRTPLPSNDLQYVARVEKVLGDARFRLVIPGETFKGIGKLPGSKRRLSRSIREGSYVLFEVWDFVSKNLCEEATEKRGDVLALYDQFDDSTFRLEEEGVDFRGTSEFGAEEAAVDFDNI